MVYLYSMLRLEPRIFEAVHGLGSFLPMQLTMVPRTKTY